MPIIDESKVPPVRRPPYKVDIGDPYAEYLADAKTKLNPPVTTGSTTPEATTPEATTPVPQPTVGATGTSSTASGTAGQKKAAANLGEVAKYNAASTLDQLKRALYNYNVSDTQNRRAADVQYKQNSRRAAGDRFAQAKKAQQATQGLMSSAGNAMQGSGLWGLIDMLRGRTDLDTGETMTALTQNQDAVYNALQEAIAANILARNEAKTTAELGLRGIEADYAAQLSNIDPSLFVSPGTGITDLGDALGARWEQPINDPRISNYIVPPRPWQPNRQKSPQSGSSYFDKLLAGYNRRR